jgi:pectate lyase
MIPMSHGRRSRAQLKSLACFFLILNSALLSGRAVLLVNDTWQDNSRAEPTAANGYAENDGVSGTDADLDGDLESAWFRGGGGTLAPLGAGGPLRGSGYGTSSASWTTYFTAESTPVTLGGTGDQLKLTWVFTPTLVNAANTSQGFRLALVDTPSAARLSSDNSPGSAAYTGYGMFMNMAMTLGGGNPFQLTKRDGSSGALLSGSGSPPWTALANGATSGNHGYDSGTQYTFVMTFTRNAANGMDITATMTGGTLNGTGTASISVTDATPGAFTFDTFSLRPSSAALSADAFDTSLFKVEFIPGATPASIDTDPDGQTVLVGQDATFNVFASGTQPLTYQWYFNTNSQVPNGTNSSLLIPNAQLSDAGAYSVIVANGYGSATSAVATLTVNVPVAPSISMQPQDQTVSPGGSAQFNVVAGGSEPLNYQWYFNTNTLIPGANDSTLTLTNVQLANAGTYSVIVSNTANSIASAYAVLTINTNPVAPSFTSQPASQVVLSGGTASFTAVAAGTAPINYLWKKNGTPISNATSSTLTLTNVQASSAGNYTVTASNNVGTATSDPAVLTVTASLPVPNSAYNLTGFARTTTGGGIIPETDPAYRKVFTALDLANAIQSANKTAGSVKVIEIMNSLDLGWNEVGAAVQNLASTPFRSHATPKLHPRLLTTGVSLIDIKSKSGLTIFSANGASIRHACFNIKSTANIIVRNLKFDELWEWDESSKGKYDGNDWDFITLGNAGTVSNIWVDHCTFTKSYDGNADIKGGSYAITFSWCKYVGDDGAANSNSWVRQQISALESNKTSYAMYNFLRTKGFSVEDIVTIMQGQTKTHLIGANDLAAENAQHTVTFHHNLFINPWDRLPRLRAGQVHNYNICVDDTLALAARRLRDQKANAMSAADRNTLNNTYSFRPFLNGSISTESGTVLVEKSVYKDCLTPLRNNQTDPSDPVYTGKIKALDTIYQFDSTVVRGNSTDPGNPLGPFQAPVIPVPTNYAVAYPYTLDDPSQLQTMLSSPTTGAGAGVLTWNKTNWLLTTYAATAPVIVTDPQNQTVSPGDSVTFSVVAGGSGPLKYQWYFNTNTLLTGATNTSLFLSNVQASNAGTYSVTVSNSASIVTSAPATLTVNLPATGFTAWQQANFTPAQLANPAISGPNATPANDGVVNLVKYALGLQPFVIASQPLVSFAVVGGEGVLTYNRPASVNDVVYRVEASTDLVNWTQSGITQQLVGTNGAGLQIWEATYTGPSSDVRFFWLRLVY